MGNARLSSDGPQRRPSIASVRTLALPRQRHSLCIQHHSASNARNAQPHRQRGAHQECVSGQDFYSASDLETKRNHYRPRLGSHLAVRAPFFHHNQIWRCLARWLQLAANTCPIGNRSRGIQCPAQSPARCRQQDQRSRSATIHLRSAPMHLTTPTSRVINFCPGTGQGCCGNQRCLLMHNPEAPRKRSGPLALL